MPKLLAFLLVVFLLLFDLNAVQAIGFPSFGNFPFPSINPFPTKTQKPSPTPLISPATSPSPSLLPLSNVLEILDVEPISADFMEEFKVTGTNFGSLPGSINFRYYKNSYFSAGAAIVSWSDTEIRAKVPAVRKGSYRIQVITADDKKSHEVKFTVKNGQPIVNSTSIRNTNGEYELVFQGTEFGSREGSVDIFIGDNLAGQGVIEYWSSSRVRFTLPSLPFQEYGFQITTKDGRKSSMKFFTVGN